MFFSVLGKGKSKFIIVDENNKRKFTIKSKGSKNNKQLIMKDRKKEVLYTVLPRKASNKPQVQIFSGEECLLTCNCVNLFVDRELDFIFMGDLRYKLSFIETEVSGASEYIISDNNSNNIGSILIKRNQKSERYFEISVQNNDIYRDYMLLFPICIELCFYANSTN